MKTKAEKAERRRWRLTPAGKAARRRHLLRVRAQVRAARNELKRCPCADCKGIFPPYVMDFDHRGEKRRLVSAAQTLEQLRVEAAKCDVVCANCHRIRTHRRARGLSEN